MVAHELLYLLILAACVMYLRINHLVSSVHRARAEDALAAIYL